MCCHIYISCYILISATLDGTNFENADLTQANIELAQFNRAIFKNTVAREMYVVGLTNFEGNCNDFSDFLE